MNQTEKQDTLKRYELNIDGLVGPTHHYAGLSDGNLASTQNALRVSNPKEAAKQGLSKMRLLHEMGLQQAILPPHPRPHLSLLQQLGFEGDIKTLLQTVYNTNPGLLNICYSSAHMWAANAATVSSSLDTKDQTVHFSAANQVTNLHRAQEAYFSFHLLKKIFPNPHYFTHHEPLPASMTLGDEGAANHSRLAASHASTGINFFVYGKSVFNPHAQVPSIYPARQTREASEAIARLHQLSEDRIIFACQNPEAIDQGVFHNDVIALANEWVLLVHEQAFLAQKNVLKNLQDTFNQEYNNPSLKIFEIPSNRLSIKEAVKTYLFNSQLLTLPNHRMTLISPIECEHHLGVKSIINDFIKDPDNPIDSVHYLNLKESMQNGGGPACLRLRVPLSGIELEHMHQGVRITDGLLTKLETWVEKHYRDRLTTHDLSDPSLVNEVHVALSELEEILDLKGLYF